MNINTWKSFILGDIIPDIHNAKAYNNSDLSESYSEDFINYITRTDRNNGVSKSVINENYKGVEEPNAITIGDTTATIYYQDTAFVAGPHIIILRAPWFNKYTCLFIITILNLEKEKYPVFGRAFSKDLIKKTCIKLPADSDGNPDYKFMENYIKNLKVDISDIPDYFLNEGYNKACWYMDNINQEKFEEQYAGRLSNNNIKLEDRLWKSFKISDLFNTYTGGDLILSNIVEGDIPIVSHTSINNGVDSFTSLIENRKLFDHNKSISLADRGTFFAARQKDDFYIGTRVKAMVFKDDIFNKYHPSKYVIDFIVTIINYEQFRFSYGRNCTNGLDDLVIRLPIDDNNEPDYLFMEEYIKTLPFSQNL